jgi:hypothetical protein
MRIATVAALAGGWGLVSLAAAAETRPAWIDPPPALAPVAGTSATPPAPLKAEAPPVEPAPSQAAAEPEEPREPAPAPVRHAALPDEEAAPQPAPAAPPAAAPVAVPPPPKSGRAARAEARNNARLGLLSGFATKAAPSPEPLSDLARPTRETQRAQIRVRIIHFRKGRVLAVYTRS